MKIEMRKNAFNWCCTKNILQNMSLTIQLGSIKDKERTLMRNSSSDSSSLKIFTTKNLLNRSINKGGSLVQNFDSWKSTPRHERSLIESNN